MTIRSVTELVEPGRPGPTAGDSGALGQQQFIELMLAQIKNQDPLNPRQDGEYLGQLAQFATVSSVQNLEANVRELSQALKSSMSLEASGLVGRRALVPAQSAYLEAGGSVEGRVQVPPGSNSVKLEIRTAGGEFVRSLPGTPLPGATETAFSWNGRDRHGNAMPPGAYLLDVHATVAGQAVGGQVLLAQPIDSVTMGQPGEPPTLNLRGGDSVSLAAVRGLS